MVDWLWKRDQYLGLGLAQIAGSLQYCRNYQLQLLERMSIKVWKRLWNHVTNRDKQAKMPYVPHPDIYHESAVR